MKQKYVSPDLKTVDVDVHQMICLSSVVDQGSNLGENSGYIDGEEFGDWYFGEPD